MSTAWGMKARVLSTAHLPPFSKEDVDTLSESALVEPREVRDSMIKCPYCGEHSFEVVTYDKAIARIPA